MEFRRFAIVLVLAVVSCAAAAADEQFYHPPGPYGDPYNIDTYNKVYGDDYGFEAPGSLRGWLFRRYAGSVEMDTKTEYPHSYHGRYIYRGWRPDWIKPTNPDNSPVYPADFVLPGPRRGAGVGPWQNPPVVPNFAPPDVGQIEEIPLAEPVPDAIPEGTILPEDLDLAPPVGRP